MATSNREIPDMLHKLMFHKVRHQIYKHQGLLRLQLVDTKMVNNQEQIPTAPLPAQINLPHRLHKVPQIRCARLATAEIRAASSSIVSALPRVSTVFQGNATAIRVTITQTLRVYAKSPFNRLLTSPQMHSDQKLI